MSWYEAIKDGISVAQQADNLPLVQNLIEAQKQIMELINENSELKSQVKSLEDKNKLSSRIIRHKDAYITLRDDNDELVYCSNCWDNYEKLVQAQTNDNGTYFCKACNTHGYYNKKLRDKQFESLNNTRTDII
ncbi:MAG: hypothetical protein RR444_03740 [Oscillospiraceae bacterium]